MNIRLRGHLIQWHKPINLKSLLRMMLLIALACPASAGVAQAGESARPSASHAEMSPAMALAIALGVRNIPGPVVKTARVTAKSGLPERQAMLLPGERESAARFVVPASRAVRKAY